MAKISVRHAAGSGYGFLAHRFIAILGLNWLPTVFLAGASAWLLAHIATVPAFLGTNGTRTGTLWLAGDLAAMLIVTAFFGAAIAVSLSREAFGLHEEMVGAHFVFGRRELRLFLAFLRLYALLAAAAAAVATLSSAALWLGLPPLLAKLHGAASNAATLALFGIPLPALVATVTSLATISTLLFLAIRFGFFLVPVAAIEDKASLARAWSLSKGNFWRLLVVSAALAVPVDVLARLVEFALYGSELGKTQATGLEAAHGLLAWMSIHAGVFSAIEAAAVAVFVALFAGTGTYAYRARLAPDTEEAPVREEPRTAATHDLPLVPAMAAPPLDVTLGDHAIAAEPAPAQTFEAVAGPEHAEAPEAAADIHTEEPAPTVEHTAEASADAHTLEAAGTVAAAPAEAAPDAHAEDVASIAPYHTADETTGSHAPEVEDVLPTGDPAPETSLDDVPSQADAHAAHEEEKPLELA